MKYQVTIALLVLAATGGLASADVLINPGFEDGALTPWYQKVDLGGPENWNVTTADAHSGMYSATDRGNKLIAQDFAAIQVSDILEASLWLRNLDMSLNVVYFQYSDGSTEENEWWPNGSWEFIDATGWLDGGKSLVSFGVYGISGAMPTERTYVDDWTLNVVPEPASLVLFGLAPLILRRR